MRLMCVLVLAALGVSAGLFVGCEMKQDPNFWVARATNIDGTGWQIYHDGEWHNVLMDGVSPPSYVQRHILAADNWFIFAGWVDSVGLIAGRLPICTIEAWNVVPPVRRRLVDFAPPDTSGLPWMTVDDFVSDIDYQRFSASSAAQFWPAVRSLERPKVRRADAGW